MPWAALAAALAALGAALAGGEGGGGSTDSALPCPRASWFFWSRRGPDTVEVDLRVQSRVPVDLRVHWVSTRGLEDEGTPLTAFGLLAVRAKVGDAFRFYTTEPRRLLVLEHRVESPGELVVRGCAQIDASAAFQASVARAPEFEALRQPHEPCSPPGQSSRWSCAQLLPPERCQGRPQELFGLTDSQARLANRSLGATEDFQMDDQIPAIPQISDGPGFLKMRMPEPLRELLDWYELRRQDSLAPEGMDPKDILHGPSSLVSLGKFPEMQQLVVRELRDVLQWWTGRPLFHTFTYGVRVYGRDAVLLHHVDRHETHLASAVLQVQQAAEGPDEGWPLEILTPERGCWEVFMQPGEMVLYEGARLKHGRPMRYRGKEFANVFTHFVPHRWEGVDAGAAEL